MIGGLFKSSSSVAVVAAAGLFMGGMALTPAQAADLGGDCCSDLEERVAELEATTVRKGNRKVSLTLSGHVNEAILFWDDGVEQNAYIGTSNYSRTRFRFKGSAKINPNLSAGYLIEIGVRRDSFVGANQTSDKGSNGLDIRHQMLFIKHKQLGTLTLGHTGSATEGITEINLGGTLASSSDMPGTHGAQFITRVNGVFAPNLTTWSNLHSPLNANVGDGDRVNNIKYTSPTLAGFVVSAAYGEDDFYDVALRYAGEFGSIRVAAGVGYQQWSDTDTGCTALAQVGPTAGASDGSASAGADCGKFGASASAMHVPSGLYITGSYGFGDDAVREANAIAAGAPVSDDEHYYIAAGIAQNFFGIGKTTVQFDYFHSETGFQSATLVSSEVDVYGLSFQQNIDAAAMQLYVGYHRFQGEFVGSVGAAPTVVDDFDTVVVGARIQF